MRECCLTLWLLCSCATLNTAGMSESCKNAYNACLNACPDAPRQGEVGPTPSPGNIDIGVAACTATCNDQASKCR